MKKGTAIKKPIEIQFIQLENTPQSILAVYKFIHGEQSVSNEELLKMSMSPNDKWYEYCTLIQEQGYMPLKTLESGEGTQNASIGDYIIRGVQGECYPCKPKIFEQTYNILSGDKAQKSIEISLQDLEQLFLSTDKIQSLVCNLDINDLQYIPIKNEVEFIKHHLNWRIKSLIDSKLSKTHD